MSGGELVMVVVALVLGAVVVKRLLGFLLLLVAVAVLISMGHELVGWVGAVLPTVPPGRP